MKIRLSIHKNYVPNWGAWEGVREFVQNALDEDDKGNPVSISHGKNGIHIKSKGAVIPHAAMAFGYSEKTDDAQSRGQYGEGMKLAMLALIREGLGVYISSGDKSYTPVIEFDKALGCNVLCIKVRSVKPKDYTVVSIDGFTEEMWDLVKTRFVRWAGFSKVSPAFSGSVKRGEVIFDEEAKGRLYVKGIWVCDVKDFQHGYNLMDVELDRDRAVPRSQFGLHWEASAVLQAALDQKKADPCKVADMILNNKAEARYVFSHGPSESSAKAVADAIKNKYAGFDAFTTWASAKRDAPSGIKVAVLPSSVPPEVMKLLPAVDDLRSKASKDAQPLSFDDMLAMRPSVPERFFTAFNKALMDAGFFFTPVLSEELPVFYCGADSEAGPAFMISETELPFSMDETADFLCRVIDELPRTASKVFRRSILCAILSDRFPVAPLASGSTDLLDDLI